MLKVGVSYARPDSSLAARVTYGKTKYNYDAPYNAVFKGNDYSVRVGNYFTDTLLGGVSYGNSKMEESNFGRSYKTRDYGLFAHYVNELGQGNALSFDGSLTSSTYDNGIERLTNTNEHVLVDYYFSRGLSAGLGFSNSSGDRQNSEGRGYSANVRYFITPRFSLNAGYTRTLSANAGAYDDDGKLFVVGMALRF